MALIDANDWIGQILLGLTNNVTGSMELTLILIIALLVFIALAVRLPVILTAVVVLPVLIVSVAIDGHIIPLVAIGLAYLGFCIADLIRNR